MQSNITVGGINIFLYSKYLFLFFRYTEMESPFCTYSHRVCMLNKLQGNCMCFWNGNFSAMSIHLSIRSLYSFNGSGYDYCIKHILEDSNAPFKQCNYVSNKTGRRCSNAAARTERKDGWVSGVFRMCQRSSKTLLFMKHRRYMYV